MEHSPSTTEPSTASTASGSDPIILHRGRRMRGSRSSSARQRSRGQTELCETPLKKGGQTKGRRRVRPVLSCLSVQSCLSCLSVCPLSGKTLVEQAGGLIEANRGKPGVLQGSAVGSRNSLCRGLRQHLGWAAACLVPGLPELSHQGRPKRSREQLRPSVVRMAARR